jgi:hypothetical protein
MCADSKSIRNSVLHDASVITHRDNFNTIADIEYNAQLTDTHKETSIYYFPVLKLVRWSAGRTACAVKTINVAEKIINFLISKDIKPTGSQNRYIISAAILAIARQLTYDYRVNKDIRSVLSTGEQSTGAMMQEIFLIISDFIDDIKDDD